MNHPLLHITALWTASALAASAFYANITIDGDFSDWNGVPEIGTDPSDNAGSIDLATMQAANDENFVYLRYTLAESINPQSGGGIFLAVDEDNNTATGFDIFGLGLVGSEAGWQNDFAFEQSGGVFNTGFALDNATYTASPYNSATVSVEIRIPRIASHNNTALPIFPADGGTVRFAFWTEEGADDFMSGSYTFSAPILFSTSLVTSVAALQIGSVSGVTYRLHYTSDLLGTNWAWTGFTVTGNGGDLWLYDPTGFSTARIYRVSSP